MSGRRRRRGSVDPALHVYRHLLASVTDEMGIALRDSAVSPNVKERLDFSCALLDADGELVAHAAHIPVHLGSAHLTVPAVLAELQPATDDVVVLNDPHRGGTHLNDVTVLTPLDVGDRRMGFLLVRAHHADVGGAEPGSMSGARDLHGEGLCLPPVRLVRDGAPVDEVWRLFEANVRDPEQGRADLQAQLAALRRGRGRFEDLVARFGADDLGRAMRDLLRHGERLAGALLAEWPRRRARAEDRLFAPDGPLIAVELQARDGRLRADFTGSSPQVPGSWNTHAAVATSAVFYVLQSLARGTLPETSGVLHRVDLELPRDAVVSSSFPAGVALGNVETSQRIVDVLLQALAQLLPGRVPACSQGTMNNLLFGGQREDGRAFVCYETLGGGAGGGPAGAGADAVQSHMTNTRNTPVEVLEAELPVRVTRLALRRSSGGRGRHRGGRGLDKEIEFLVPARVMVAGTRRTDGPPGAEGGGAGRCGRDQWIPQGERARPLGPGEAVEVQPGDRVRVRTPGGGGWGEAGEPPGRGGSGAQSRGDS